MHFVFYAVMVFVTQLYRMSSMLVSKLLCASPAWHQFTTATDVQRVDAFLHRSKHSQFCPADLPTFEQLLEDADQKLLTILSISINFFHQPHQHHSATNSGKEHIYEN